MRVFHFCPFWKAQRIMRGYPWRQFNRRWVKAARVIFKVKYEEFPDIENFLALE